MDNRLERSRMELDDNRSWQPGTTTGRRWTRTDGVGSIQHDVGDGHEGGEGHKGGKLLLHALVILLSAMSPIVDSAQKKKQTSTQNKIKYRV